MSLPARYRRFLSGLLLSLSVAVLLFALPFLPGLLNGSDFYGLQRGQSLSAELWQPPAADSVPDTQPELDLVFFGYLQCGTVCPQQLVNLKQLHDRLQGQPVRFLFVSLDPQRDTQAELDQAMSALGPGFQALRPASDRAARQLMLAFNEGAARYASDNGPQGSGYDFDHSGFLHVVRRSGVLELTYTSSVLDLNRVEQDLMHLLARNNGRSDSE